VFSDDAKNSAYRQRTGAAARCLLRVIGMMACVTA
jgi:hypothetical protein